jgi:hypothetical protein
MNSTAASERESKKTRTQRQSIQELSVIRPISNARYLVLTASMMIIRKPTFEQHLSLKIDESNAGAKVHQSSRLYCRWKYMQGTDFDLPLPTIKRLATSRITSSNHTDVPLVLTFLRTTRKALRNRNRLRTFSPCDPLMESRSWPHVDKLMRSICTAYDKSYHPCHPKHQRHRYSRVRGGSHSTSTFCWLDEGCAMLGLVLSNDGSLFPCSRNASQRLGRSW